MYSFAKKFNSNKNTINLKKNDDINDNLNLKHTNYSTDLILNKLKIESFKNIFEILNAGDNRITLVANNFKKLPKEIQSILEPLKIKLKLENLSINKEEFIEYCDELFEVYFVYLIRLFPMIKSNIS